MLADDRQWGHAEQEELHVMFCLRISTSFIFCEPGKLDHAPRGCRHGHILHWNGAL